MFKKRELINQLQRMGLALPKGRDRSLNLQALYRLFKGETTSVSLDSFSHFDGRCPASRHMLGAEIQKKLALGGHLPWFSEKSLPKKKYLVDFLFSISPGNAFLTRKRIKKREMQKAPERVLSEDENDEITNLVKKAMEAARTYRPTNVNIFMDSTPKFFDSPRITRQIELQYDLKKESVKKSIKIALSRFETLHKIISSLIE